MRSASAGWISERWIGSTTKADNRVGPPDEGLSYVGIPGERITLKAAVEDAGELIMGAEYATTHKGLGRLAKIYDFGARIPYHIHQMEKDAKLVGANSKEEAYYFPEDVDLGPHPETFFGVHPYIVREGKQDILLKYLVEWKDDLILQHSQRVPERARGRLPPAVRRVARARHRADYRAAGRLRRLRHAPGTERR